MIDKKDKLKTELFITGIIDDNSASKFIDETQDIIDNFIAYKSETSYVKDSMIQNFPTITVTINSPGGDIYAGNLIVSRIKEMQDLEIPLMANGITCMSMAFIIYITFNKRTADKLFAGMNHSSRSHYMGYREEVRSDLDHSDYMDSLYDNMIREQTNIPEDQIEASRLKCIYYGYDEAVELGIINYYEGCEKQVEEEMDRVSDALESALEVFSQLLGMEKEDGFDLMLDLLAPIYEEVEEVKDKEEVETTEDKEDKNELSEVLGEILDKAMDEDKVKDTDEVPARTFDIITLKDEVMEEVKEELKDITNADYDGCYCGNWSIYIDNLGYLTLSSSCRKGDNCPDGKEYHIDEKVYILDKNIIMEDDVEILFEIEPDQALKIVNMAYSTLYKDCGMDEFGNYLKRKGE